MNDFIFNASRPYINDLPDTKQIIRLFKGALYSSCYDTTIAKNVFLQRYIFDCIFIITSLLVPRYDLALGIGKLLLITIDATCYRRLLISLLNPLRRKAVVIQFELDKSKSYAYIYIYIFVDCVRNNDR